jgi:phosphatidylglycerol---prolipoprotein diacylglyceryl transferase
MGPGAVSLRIRGARLRPPVGILLQIPWFKAEPWLVPLPFVDWELPLQPFGLLVAIGVLFGAKVAEWYAKRHGIAPGAMADFATHTVLSGFIFGYFLNGVFYHPETMVEIVRSPSLLLTRWIGLSSYGGFLGAVVGALVWRWRRGVAIVPMADGTAFAFPFAWLFGRTGCFVVHDHPGRETDFFLAVEGYQVGMPPYLPRHDLGLYEVFWCLACIVLFVALLRVRRPHGFYLALVLLAYTPVRFFLDFLRAEPEAGGDVRYFALTPGQYASITGFVVGLWLMRRVFVGPTAELPAEVRWPPPEPEPEPELAEPDAVEPGMVDPAPGEPAPASPAESSAADTGASSA